MSRPIDLAILGILAVAASCAPPTEPRPVLALAAAASPNSLYPGQTSSVLVSATLDGEAVSAAGSTFTSSPAVVATVSATGVITAHTAGSATITVSLDLSGGVTASTTASITVLEGGVILPAGNTIQNADGSIVLVAPAGAVAAPTAVALSTTARPWVDPTLARGSVWSVGTVGLTFLQPVSVQARYTASMAPYGLPQAALGLRRAGASTWTDHPSVVDSTINVVTSSITQGGTYSVGRLVPAAPCTADEHRAWDFWIGEWILTNPGGASGGENSITAEAGGCAIFENYTNPVAALSPGRSISFYNPATDKWYQTYIDNGGNEVRLASTVYSASGITTVSTLVAPNVYRRVTWSTLPAGKVRQFSEFTTNNGATFQVEYDLTYTRKP